MYLNSVAIFRGNISFWSQSWTSSKLNCHESANSSLCCATQTYVSIFALCKQHGLVSHPNGSSLGVYIIYKTTSQIDKYCCCQLLLRSVPFSEPERVYIVIHKWTSVSLCWASENRMEHCTKQIREKEKKKKCPKNETNQQDWLQRNCVIFFFLN